MNTKWRIVKTGIKQYRAYKKFLRLSDEKKNNSLLPAQSVAAIIELGPVFIKVGQILSTRPDILPVQYIAALEKLQENVPPFDFKEAKKIIEEELSQPLQQIFQSVEEKPITSASLSQVHFAVLKSGEKVALKVQRPDVKTKILNDLKKFEEILVFFKFFFQRKKKERTFLMDSGNLKDTQYRNWILPMKEKSLNVSGIILRDGMIFYFIKFIRIIVQRNCLQWKRFPVFDLKKLYKNYLKKRRRN